MPELTISKEDSEELVKLAREMDRLHGHFMDGGAKSVAVAEQLVQAEAALGAAMVKHRKILLQAFMPVSEEEDPKPAELIAAIHMWRMTPVNQMPIFLKEGWDLYLALASIAMKKPYDEVCARHKANEPCAVRTRYRIKLMVGHLITFAPTSLLQIHDETLVDFNNEQRDQEAPNPPGQDQQG